MGQTSGERWGRWVGEANLSSGVWVSRITLLVRLSITPPYMLERGVLTQLERLEFMDDVWLDPGMFKGEGPKERCRTVWLTLRTVWKTRFGCSLNRYIQTSEMTRQRYNY